MIAFEACLWLEEFMLEFVTFTDVGVARDIMGSSGVIVLMFTNSKIGI